MVDETKLNAFIGKMLTRLMQLFDEFAHGWAGFG
jgi:hypothetical protein